jgi:hypothetical protein
VAKRAAAALLTNLVGDLRSQILAEHGAPDARVELTAALVALWRDGETETAWLHGSPVFPDSAAYGATTYTAESTGDIKSMGTDRSGAI